MKYLLTCLAALGLLVPVVVWAQPASRSAPPSCSVAQLAAGTCAPARLGTRVRIRNADAAVDENCALDTGAEAIICEYNGTNWVSTDLAGDDLSVGTSQSATFGAPNNMLADRTTLNQIIGIPKLNITHTGALPDGTATAAIVTPLAATCIPVAHGTEADDAVNFVTGAASYQYTAAATAAENDGFDCDFTGHANVEVAIEGMELGAFDYLLKPTEIDQLLYKLQDAYQKKAIQDSRIQKRKENLEKKE